MAHMPHLFCFHKEKKFLLRTDSNITSPYCFGLYKLYRLRFHYRNNFQTPFKELPCTSFFILSAHDQKTSSITQITISTFTLIFSKTSFHGQNSYDTICLYGTCLKLPNLHTTLHTASHCHNWENEMFGEIYWTKTKHRMKQEHLWEKEFLKMHLDAFSSHCAGTFPPL